MAAASAARKAKGQGKFNRSQAQLTLLDAGLLDTPAERIQSFVKNNRKASFRDVAAACDCSVNDVERVLKPPGEAEGMPPCSHRGCNNDGRFGIRRPGWEALKAREPLVRYCGVHCP